MLQSHIKSLTGFRGFACLIVLLGHSQIYHGHLIEGFRIYAATGVMLFFVLSGFLMAHLYTDEIPLKGRFLFSFFIKRVFRIFPAYIFVLFLHYYLSSFGFISRNDRLFMGWHSLYQHLLLMKAAFVYWSVTAELSFYLTFPAVLVMMWWLRNEPLFLFSILFSVWIFSAFVFNLGVTTTSLRYGSNPAIFLPYAEFFIAGILAAHVYKHYVSKIPESSYFDLGFLLCFVAIILVQHLYVPDTRQTQNFILLAGPEFTLFFSACSGAMILFLAHAKGVVRKAFESSTMQFLGTISFSLYLVHMLVYNFINTHLPERLQFFSVTGMVVLSIITAWVVYECVENPARKLGTWILKKAPHKAVRG